MKLMSLLAVTVLAIPGMAIAANAKHAGDVAAGGTLARQTCAMCHNVSVREDGPNPYPLAPEFRNIAKLKSTTAISLHAFLATPHLLMPNLILSEKQMSDITAYILDMRDR